MELPPPPFLSHYLFEVPWPGALLILILGMVALRVAVRLQNKRLLWVALGIMAGAPSLVCVAFLTETTGELLRQQTFEFIDAATQGQGERTQRYLSHKVQVLVGVNDAHIDKAGLVRRINAIKLRIESNRITTIKSVVTGPKHGLSVFRQVTTPNAGYPTPNQWRVEWELEPGEQNWRIVRITWELWGIDEVPSLSDL